MSTPDDQPSLLATLKRWKRARRSTRLWLCLAELQNYFKAPANQRRLWDDYAATRAWYRKIAPAVPPVRPNRVAMVGCMAVYPHGNKLEAMLALGLRLEGWQIKVLLNSRKDVIPRRIFMALGFHDFVYWEDFERPHNAQTEAEADAELAKWMTGELTIQSVKQWTLGPCWLGPQVISLLHRHQRQVGLDLNSPEIRQALLGVGRFAISRAHRAEAILDKVKPDLLYLMEPNYAQFGPLVDHAVHRKIRTIHMAQFVRDDAVQLWRLDLGTRRQHPLTVPRETLDAMVREPWTEAHEARLESEFALRYSGKWFLQRRNQLGATPRSREEIVRQLDLDPDKKIVSVFSHVLWDANLFYGTDLFDDYGDWFVQTVLAAYRNDQASWLIKLHPANVSKRRQENITAELAELVLIREKCGPLPPHVKLLLPDCGISSLSLYEISDCGVTVRGTCGIEMPCFGTPVITAGTGRYSGLGFTLDSTTRAEYLDRLANVQNIQPLSAAEVLRARQHAYTVFVRRPWKMKTFRAEFNEDLKAAKASTDPLVHNLVPAAQSLEELRANGDLAKWAHWAEHGTRPDYLDEEE